MPVKVTKDEEGRCYASWGADGKKYFFKCGDRAAREKAKFKAAKQGRAIKGG